MSTVFGSFGRVVLAAAIIGAAAPMAFAQSPSVEVVPGSAMTERKYVTLLGIKSGTVAPSGLGFGSLAVASGRTGRLGSFDDPDGSAAVGLGFGDAVNAVGLQVSAIITSLEDDFGDSGYFSMKAGRQVVGGDQPVYAALSVDGIGGWGDSANNEEAFSLAVTWFLAADLAGGGSYPVMMTVGAGSDLRENRSEPGVFLGAGIGLTRNIGTSLAWTGETVTLGSAFTIDGLDNVSFTASVDDLFDQNDSQRITVSASWFVTDLF